MLFRSVMGAESRDERNEAARAMLDFGFSNYALYAEPECELEYADVMGGVKDNVAVYSEKFVKLINKADKNRIEKEYTIPESICAPLTAGDVVGRVTYKLDGEIIGESDVFVKEDVKSIGLLELYARIMKTILTGNYQKAD